MRADARLALLLTLLGLAGGLAPATAAPFDGRAAGIDRQPNAAEAALEAGDADWFAGRRRAGARSWRRALRAVRGADAPRDVATRIRAHVRLMRAGTVWSHLIRTVLLDRALTRCPPAAPVCQRAFADVEVLGPDDLRASPASLAMRLAYLERFDLSAAASHRAWVTGELRGLRALPAPARDGLGRAMIEGLVSDPPLAEVGLGVVADGGLGIGLGVHAVSHDILRRRVGLSVDGVIARHGGGGTVGVQRSGTRWRAALWGHGVRTRWFDVETERFEPAGWGGVQLGVHRELVGTASTQLWIGGGPELRWDVGRSPSEPLRAGHGLWVSTTARLPLTEAAHVVVEAQGRATPAWFGDYARLAAHGALRAHQRWGRLRFAQRIYGEVARGDDLPATRQPMLGGAWRLRSAPPGALRGLRAGLFDAEAQVRVGSWLGVAAFAEGGAVPGATLAGGGLGLRVRPGGSGEPLRVDVGGSRMGFQVQVAWGEALQPWYP